MYQEIKLVGHLGGDPELRYTPSGAAVCNFSVATSNRYTNSNGEQVDETTWFRVSAWNKSAEAISQYLHKGSRVLVIGRLRPDENGSPRIFTRSDGTPGTSFEVVSSKVLFLDRAPGGNGNSEPMFETAEAPEF